MKYEITRPLPRQMVELANGRQHRWCLGLGNYPDFKENRFQVIELLL
jgi:hypothetical protein